jgi:hypothetical protein
VFAASIEVVFRASLADTSGVTEVNHDMVGTVVELVMALFSASWIGSRMFSMAP